MNYKTNVPSDKANLNRGNYNDYQGQSYLLNADNSGQYQQKIQPQQLQPQINEQHPHMYQRGINQNVSTGFEQKDYYNYPGSTGSQQMPVPGENYKSGNMNNMQTNFPPQQNYPLGSGPLMADMAMMYGSRIMDTGKEMVDKELNRYVSLARVKHYFSVDTVYVLKKLKILLFPFTNNNWTPKIIKGQLAVPRDDINAPDLYIPLMAYITYVLLAGVVMGTNNAFSPEALGMLASQALAFTLIELAIQTINIYITNLQTQFSTWDLIAYPGYKFVGIIVAVLTELAFNRVGYFIGLLYCSLTMSFFLVRSLKWRMMKSNTIGSGLQDNVHVHQMYQKKRGLFFLFSIALSQPFVMWWLSRNLSVHGIKLETP